MKVTTTILITILMNIRSSSASCCAHGDRSDTGCSACPASWYSSCSGNYNSDIGSEGCGFLGAGCRRKCSCSAICGCYDSNNNIDHAKCQRGGDSWAQCNDGGQTSTSYSCTCSAGYHDQGGNCVNYDGCQGGVQTCRNEGDTSASCVDRAASTGSNGFDCSCSSGFYDSGGICSPKKCPALALSDGVIGTGSNACTFLVKIFFFPFSLSLSLFLLIHSLHFHHSPENRL